jgi:hypothetical protein
MNYKIEQINSIIPWRRLCIIADNNFIITYMIYYNNQLNYYYTYINANHSEIIEYLVSNNICTSDRIKPGHSQKLILNPHILLELI